MPTTSLLESGVDRGPVTYLDSRYTRWIEREGMTPLLISPAFDDTTVRHLVELSDGLALVGGEDVHPSAYGEPPHRRLGTVNAPRDRVEQVALEAAEAVGFPILALCRGIQVLNVARGGSLWQDLPEQRPGPVAHRQSAAWFATAHPLRVEAGSRLAAILGTDSVDVNSFHHQAIRDLGEGLRATAWAPDGVIEAVEDDRGWVVGVQWHPERHPDDAPADHPDRLLFSAFATAVRARSGGAADAA